MDITKANIPVTAAVAIGVGLVSATGSYFATLGHVGTLETRIAHLEGAKDEGTKQRLDNLESAVGKVSGQLEKFTDRDKLADWYSWRASTDILVKGNASAAAGMANDIVGLEKTQKQIQESLGVAGNERFRLTTRVEALEARR